MKNRKKYYITTAVDYVNSAPHVGHAYEKVLADALARWHKLRGDKVWYLTGTDKNAQKNRQTKIPMRTLLFFFNFSPLNSQFLSIKFIYCLLFIKLII